MDVPPVLESAAVAADIRPQNYQPARTELELQGYVGKYPIRAVLPVTGGATFDGHVGDTWRGAYRYIGKERDLQLEGGRTLATEQGEPMEQEYSPTGAPSEQFECQFEERVAGRITGLFRGACDTAENELIVRGTWRDPSGARELPFFLGPIGEWAAFDQYYRAILKTPGPAHECAAHVRVGASLALPDGSQLVSYLLRWPCEEESTGKSSARAFLGKLDPGAPHRFLVPPLPFGGVDSNAELSVTLLSGGVSRTRTYLIRIDAFTSAGTDSIRCCWSHGRTRRFLLPVTRQGKLGRVVELTETTVASGQPSCQNQSASYEFAELELDGQPGPELVATLRQEAERIQQTPQGPSAYVCVPTPSHITHRAFRFDEGTPRLVPMTIDVNRLEKALPTRRVLEGGA